MLAAVCNPIDRNIDTLKHTRSNTKPNCKIAYQKKEHSSNSNSFFPRSHFTVMKRGREGRRESGWVVGKKDQSLLGSILLEGNRNEEAE